MKHDALLISIRKLRMIELDGVGAFAQVELMIARKAPDRAKTAPRVDIASLTLFAPSKRKMGGGLR